MIIYPFEISKIANWQLNGIVLNLVDLGLSLRAWLGNLIQFDYEDNMRLPRRFAPRKDASAGFT